MQIRSTAWVLAQLLTLVVDKAFPMQAVAPWCSAHALGAGLVALWKRIESAGIPLCDRFIAMRSVPRHSTDWRGTGAGSQT
ncbi:MAG: hypothetical protein WAR81_08270 [Pseudomonadales bacterium]|jgi:hypothetical protein